LSSSIELRDNINLLLLSIMVFSDWVSVSETLFWVNCFFFFQNKMNEKFNDKKRAILFLLFLDFVSQKRFSMIVKILRFEYEFEILV